MKVSSRVGMCSIMHNTEQHDRCQSARHEKCRILPPRGTVFLLTLTAWLSPFSTGGGKFRFHHSLCEAVASDRRKARQIRTFSWCISLSGEQLEGRQGCLDGPMPVTYKLLTHARRNGTQHPDQERPDPGETRQTRGRQPSPSRRPGKRRERFCPRGEESRIST